VIRTRILWLALIGTVFHHPAFAWLAEGHEVVAVIAADNLTPAAKAHVASILNVSDDPISIARAMESASVRPDTEFRADKTTSPWHYIDLCLQDTERELPARCPGGNCVTAKIDEYAYRLRVGQYDKWGAAGDLAFLIHFVADIHQPLHAATNADRGGTCQKIEVIPAEPNLHYAWDDAVVVEMEDQLGTHSPEATAGKLERLYPAASAPESLQPDDAERIAWESHLLAKSAIYGALGIPQRPCMPDSCDPGARSRVRLDRSYMEGAAQVAERQLVKAGLRLAALLNRIWAR
jgi:nuclease S1